MPHSLRGTGTQHWSDTLCLDNGGRSGQAYSCSKVSRFKFHVIGNVEVTWNLKPGTWNTFGWQLPGPFTLCASAGFTPSAGSLSLAGGLLVLFDVVNASSDACSIAHLPGKSQGFWRRFWANCCPVLSSSRCPVNLYAVETAPLRVEPYGKYLMLPLCAPLVTAVLPRWSAWINATLFWASRWALV